MVVANVEAAIHEVGLALDVGAAVEAADGDDDEYGDGDAALVVLPSPSRQLELLVYLAANLGDWLPYPTYWRRSLPRCNDSSVSFQEVVFYFSDTYTISTNNSKQRNFERKTCNKSTKCPTGRANLFTLIFGKQSLF